MQEKNCPSHSVLNMSVSIFRKNFRFISDHLVATIFLALSNVNKNIRNKQKYKKQKQKFVLTSLLNISFRTTTKF